MLPGFVVIPSCGPTNKQNIYIYNIYCRLIVGGAQYVQQLINIKKGCKWFVIKNYKNLENDVFVYYLFRCIADPTYKSTYCNFFL